MLKYIAGLTLALALGGATEVLAQASPPGAPSGAQQNFPQHKQMHLTRIGKHIVILQQEQACVQAAANAQAVHACLQQREAAVQALRTQYQGLN